MWKAAEPCATCQWCGAAIYYGNAMATVTRNIEQIDRTRAHPEGTVTVIQSDTLLTLCARCANRLDSEMLQTILRTGFPSR